jgi:hypothetical protein
MSAIYPTPAHSDLAVGRKGEHATFAHPRERTRDPLIDHPRPAPPSCCHLPLLPHRCCHTALATWARLGCLYADDATLLLPRHCYHTAMLILPRRRYRAADAALLPLPHCRCGHTAAATLRMLHCILLANATPAAAVPADDTPTAATTPAASMPAAATPAATPTTTATPAPASRTRATLHSATATGPLVTPHLPQPRQPPSTPPLTAHPSPEAAGKWPEDSSNPQVHGQHTGTRGMVHPTLCRVAHSTNPTNSVQKQYKNRPTTIQEPSNNRTTTRTHTVHPHRRPPARRSKGRA